MPGVGSVAKQEVRDPSRMKIFGDGLKKRAGFQIIVYLKAACYDGLFCRRGLAPYVVVGGDDDRCRTQKFVSRVFLMYKSSGTLKHSFQRLDHAEIKKGFIDDDYAFIYTVLPHKAISCSALGYGAVEYACFCY